MNVARSNLVSRVEQFGFQSTSECAKQIGMVWWNGYSSFVS